jgi:hypothetical protein
VFKNRALRRILGPKTEEVTKGWKNCIMSLVINSLIIITTIIVTNMMTLKDMRWAEHESCMGKTRNAYRFPVENRNERYHLKFLRVHEGDTIKSDKTG